MHVQRASTLNPSSPVIKHIIAVNRVLGRTQIARIFTYCLQSLDIRLNYYFTLNEQRTELHNNKSSIKIRLRCRATLLPLVPKMTGSWRLAECTSPIVLLVSCVHSLHHINHNWHFTRLYTTAIQLLRFFLRKCWPSDKSVILIFTILQVLCFPNVYAFCDN